MKNAILLLMALAPLPAIAGIDDCNKLLGTYTCPDQSKQITLILSRTASADGLLMDIGGQKEVLQLNGRQVRSQIDDSYNVAQCNQQGAIEINNYFKNAFAQQFLITETKDGVQFLVTRNDGKKFPTACVRTQVR